MPGEQVQVHVRDIVAGAADSTGAQILTVYGRVADRYAVYRTAEQVMIQFADDDDEGVNQRAALAPLGTLRGQVNGLISALRDDPAAYQQGKAKAYDLRVATALLVGLQGDPTQGAAALAEVKADLEEDRASDVRTRHLLFAGAATVAAILAARFLASDWFGSAFGRFDPEIIPYYWNAAAIGALAAFFSIALQIRARAVPIDPQPWDNIMDAVLRIFVGSLSAVILIALLRGGFVELRIAGAAITEGIHGLVIAAFAGGFTERLVSTFLAGAALTGRASAAAAPPATPGVPPVTNERTMTGERSSGPSAGAPSGNGGGNAAGNAGEEAVEPNEDEAEAPGADRDPATRVGALDPVG